MEASLTFFNPKSHTRTCGGLGAISRNLKNLKKIRIFWARARKYLGENRIFGNDRKNSDKIRHFKAATKNRVRRLKMKIVFICTT